MFSSKTDDWATPINFFRKLDEEFGFDLDVCASIANAKASRYFTREDDGLSRKWSGCAWMNPPYGREIGRWIRKAFESVESGDAQVVVCLVPARTDTAWWHDYCQRGEVRFVRGRLKFGDSKNSAPFPSAVVIFRGKP